MCIPATGKAGRGHAKWERGVILRVYSKMRELPGAGLGGGGGGGIDGKGKKR